jgi:hypothetical protein
VVRFPAIRIEGQGAKDAAFRFPIPPLVAILHRERPGAQLLLVQEARGFAGDRAIEPR